MGGGGGGFGERGLLMDSSPYTKSSKLLCNRANFCWSNSISMGMF